MYIIIDVMGKNAVVLLPSVQKVLTELGENIKLARLRRGLSSELMAERAGISRATLVNVEKDDELGRKLQDLMLVTRKRAPKDKRQINE